MPLVDAAELAYDRVFGKRGTENVTPSLDEAIVAEIEKNYGAKLRAAMDTTGQDKITSYAAVDA